MAISFKNSRDYLSGQLLTFPSVSYLEFEILHMAFPESGPQSPAGQCP